MTAAFVQSSLHQPSETGLMRLECHKGMNAIVGFTLGGNFVMEKYPPAYVVVLVARYIQYGY